jgi:hypothetical protein
MLAYLNDISNPRITPATVPMEGPSAKADRKPPK